jgi:diaminopimelate epimerase
MVLWFSKYEALGNDFIIIDLRVPQGGENFSPHEFAKKYCDRNFGIGADGVIPLYNPSSQDSDFKIKIINSDGSEAEMSGNGIRCVAKYIYDMNLSNKEKIVFETGAGRREVKRTQRGFEVNMGKPQIIGKINYHNLELFRVSVGNPHLVFLGDFDYELFFNLAPKISKVENANVVFAMVKDKNLIEVMVFERGVGETLACGTGAVAVFSVAKERNLVDDEAKIMFKGGSIFVSKKGEYFFLEGSANLVFSGFVRLS